MKTIWLKEIKSYFNSMTGYVFLAVFLFAEGIYHYIYNYVYLSADYPYALEGLGLVFIFIVPLFSMRTFAHERKKGTLVMLVSSPVSSFKIVLAKYLANLSVFFLGCLVISVHPIIMSGFGEVNMAASYWALFIFFLMGAGVLALGMFISVLCPGELVAGIVTFACMTLIAVADPFFEMLRGKSIPVPYGIMPLERMEDALGGKASTADVIYFLILILTFVILSVIFLERPQRYRKGNGTNIPAAVTVVIVLCSVILINLCADTFKLERDLTVGGLYSLSDESEQFLDGLTDEVSITYYTGENGEEKVITDIIEKMADVADNLSFKVATEGESLAYIANKGEESQFNSGFLVENHANGLSKYVDIGEILVSSIDYETLSYRITGLDLEGRLVSAISFVTDPNRPVIGLLTGHGEEEISSGILALIQREGIESRNISLLAGDDLTGFDAIVLNAPATDISDSEYDAILEYLLEGGKALVITDGQMDKMPNFDALVLHYGVETQPGSVIREGNSSYCAAGNDYEIFPSILDSAVTKDISKSEVIVFPYASPLYIKNNLREELSVIPLLETSEEAFLSDPSTGDDIEESKEVLGSYYVGVDAREDYPNGTYSEMIIFSTPYMSSDMFLWGGPFVNAQLLSASLKALAPYESPVLAPVKNVETATLVISSNTATLIAILYIALIPILVLLLGALNLWRRRHL